DRHRRAHGARADAVAHGRRGARPRARGGRAARLRARRALQRERHRGDQRGPLERLLPAAPALGARARRGGVRGGGQARRRAVRAVGVADDVGRARGHAPHRAPVHRVVRAARERVAPLPARPIHPAVGVRQARRDRLDGDARDQEGRAAAPPHAGAAAVPRGRGGARGARRARARPLGRDDVLPAHGRGAVRRRRARRALHRARRARHPGALEGGRAAAVRAPPHGGLPRPRERAVGGELPAHAVAHRRGLGARHRRGVRAGAAAVRLPAVRLHRLRGQQRGRGVGVRGDARARGRVRRLRLARAAHRRAGAHPLPPPLRRGAHRHHGDHRLPAHRGGGGAPAHHRAHAPLRLLRALEPRALAAHHRRARQHRQRARAGDRRGRHRPSGGGV
ncbi:MAG: Cell division protein FtsW, partial [uncultured Gemmatimonadaceae bacterium]